MDVLKEVFSRPVASSAYGPVLAEEDVIGTKVRALAERASPVTPWTFSPPPAVGPPPTWRNSADATPATASTSTPCRPA